VICINTTPTASVTPNDEPLECMEDFTYLGSLISKDNAAQKDIKVKTVETPLCFCQTSFGSANSIQRSDFTTLM